MKPVTALFVCALLASCSSPDSGSGENAVNPAIEALHAEVMSYHDEVMPEMGTLYSLRSEINAAADTLPAAQADSLRLIAGRLERADEAMMAWMRQFSSQLTNQDTLAARQYYEDQLQKVQAMRDEVATALEAGAETRRRLTE